MIGEFIVRCMHARTNAHILHLKSRSYAQHKALQGFYEGLVELIDRYAEAYQGSFGLIEDYSGRYVSAETPQKLIDGLCDYIDENKDELSAGEESLENVLAEMCELCQSTAYKLRFLA